MKKSRFAATVCAAVLLGCTVTGCSITTPAPPPREQSLYQQLGGRAGITAIVDDAIGNIAADPRINQRFRATSANHLKTNLIDLLCQRSGGPCVYAGRNMADAHDGMQIGDDEFDALVQDIAKSFDKFKVPAAERGESLAILNQMRGAIVGH
jgi:hemoglobin